ncbi:LTA synthase family protein [Halarcobacter anaerophilus]|uniref:LTA synthase family protein n=1 Tax=Halarcobacter anaerophilus TaxID=877500 RepID=UPI001165C2C4|nr:LTA synthase family protein [Halarcobacter anaerophilus]QDF28751.1 sulfatase [Halarcobacter anaerophilus]
MVQIAKKLFKYYLFLVSIFFIGRVVLFTLYFSHFEAQSTNIWLSFLYGLKMDTIVASILLVIPSILLTLLPKIFAKTVNFILKYYFLIVVSLAIFIEIATFPFMAEYDSRPNYLFVEYLAYSKEVVSLLLADYKLQLFFAFGVIALFIYGYLKKYNESFIELFEINFLKRALLFIPLVLILFIGIRSSFGHRPANISDAMYSSNRILNEVTKNSIYSIGYAVYSSLKYSNKDIQKRYGKMDIKEAIARVQKKLDLKKADSKYILSREEDSNFSNKKTKNIVIFVQESLGYQFVNAVGGEEGITPNLNRLSKEGILFKELYSNGTRSVRGLSGLVSGTFSVPGKGVVKRNKSQRDFSTIASLLKPFGYHSSFIYGGESRFDNMKSWFLGNGFDEVIDQEKFKNPEFVGTWGVSDEDVVKKANEEYKKLYAKNQKFVSVIFSTSNHTPFDFPKEKIKLVKGEPEKSVKNAVKYADYAIGKFIEMAKKEKYFEDTIFVIAADHNVRVYGDDVVPVKMFHIPGLILGKDLKPQVYDKISTQADLLATTLDLAGISTKYSIMGHSIFSDKKRDFSLMQFNDRYALRQGNEVAVIRPNTKALTFEYKNEHLYKAQNDESLQKDLLAFILVLNHVYQNKLFR